MITAIVPAAGRSRRMGMPKLLLPLAGTTVIGCVVDAILDASIADVLVVIRPDDAPLRAALAERNVRLVGNPDPDGDMLSSVRCGLLALPANTETVLLVPGDQAPLGAALVRGLIAAYRASERSIAVPIHAGRRGHPLLFSAGYRDEILSRFDGVGLRGLLLAHPGEILEWPAPDAAVLEDMDGPDDYRRVLQRAAGSGWEERKR